MPRRPTEVQIRDHDHVLSHLDVPNASMKTGALERLLDACRTAEALGASVLITYERELDTLHMSALPNVITLR